MKTKKIIFFSTALLAVGMLVGCNKGPTTYTVTFDTEGGSAVASVKVEANKPVARPAQNPTPDDPNYGFEDWYDAKTEGNVYNFDSLITKDTTIYARFGKRPDSIYAKSFRKFAVNEAINQYDFIVGVLYKGESNYKITSDFTIDNFGSGYVFTNDDVTAGTKSFTVRFKSGGEEKTTSCAFGVLGNKVDYYTDSAGTGFAVSGNATKSIGHVVIPTRAVVGDVRKNVTEIKQEAFDGSADITGVSIGGNVLNIYTAAFRNCTNLSEAYLDFKGDDINIGVSAFYGLTNLQTLYFNGSKTEWENYVHCETGWRTGSTFTVTCNDGVISFN